MKDNRGIPLVFIDRSPAFLLNFFYFNGWELANSFNPSKNDGKIILRKISK